MGVLLYRLGGRIGGNRKATSMAKGDMYINLRVYLENSHSARITLSFDEIEHIIGTSLPPSASKYPNPWWANSRSHSQACAWCDAGFRTVDVSGTYGKKSIVFVRA